METHKKVVTQWLEFEVPEPLPRDIPVSLNHDFVVTITGPRRAGKTYLCFQIMQGLFKSGVPRGNVLYINFEDEKLLGAEAADLDAFLDAFYELSSVKKAQKVYLFLDEIQNVKNWDVWVRRINDMRKDIKMVLTGSSSKLLSREISTKLRGRVVNTTVLPLGFKEYLSWRKVEYDAKKVLYSKQKTGVKKAFAEYLKNGGYPALAVGGEPREQILQEYFRSMIFKDVVERYNVRDAKKLNVLADLLFESVAKEVSYSKLSNRLKSLGYSISKTTVVGYLSYFEDAYLFFQNMKYEYSLAKQLGSIKKLYCIDNGLLNAVSFKVSEDLGRLMENLVFLELKRRNKEIYYFRNGGECDFLVREKNRVVQAIQVAKELNDENSRREFKGLLSALETHGLKEGVLLVDQDVEETREVEGRKVLITPVWKWLLE